MIKTVSVLAPDGTLNDLELINPWSTGIAITKIDGIGPVKADISTSAMSSIDGSIFNKARIGNRNIVISLRFLDSVSSIEDVRLRTYNLFPVKQNVVLTFKTDHRDVFIEGYVESNEPDIFSAAESSTVSIICTDPFFKDVDDSQTHVEYYNVSPMFEFPFLNESLTSSLLEFGNVEVTNSMSIEYQGHVETGVIIYADVTDPVTDPTFFNHTNNQYMTISSSVVTALTGYGFIAGDRIIIKTVPGKKAIYLYRQSSYINITNALLITGGSQWLKLYPQSENTIGYTTTTQGNPIRMSVSWNNLYEGI